MRCKKDPNCEFKEDCDIAVLAGVDQEEACRDIHQFKEFRDDVKENIEKLGIDTFLARTIWNMNAEMLEMRRALHQLRGLSNLLSSVEKTVVIMPSSEPKKGETVQ
jgi:D-alanyl-D-alanine dipeptidase